MKHQKISNESQKWLEQGIITKEQRKQIVNLYPKKDRNFLLLCFAGLFIGLGFLTFIASNWSAIPQFGRMAIILCFMLGFYIFGDRIYREKSTAVGISFIMIGVFIFGAGIFLTGQMFNYMYFEATQFLIWSVAAFLLFVAYEHAALYIVAIGITTVGQLYSAFVYTEFHLFIFLILLLGFGHSTYHHARNLYSSLFATSFIIQTLLLVVTENFAYYWLIVCFLVLYLVGDIVGKLDIKKVFRLFSLISIFVLTVIQIFMLSNPYIWEHLEKSIFFIICWTVLFSGSIAIKLWKNDRGQLVDLVLFLPLFYLSFADMFYMLLLFIFSIGYLLIGYNEENQSTINYGTVSFLISTLIAYVHLAWDFLDKSLFFFLGGILLFLLSFFLERKRRSMKKGVKGGSKE